MAKATDLIHLLEKYVTHNEGKEPASFETWLDKLTKEARDAGKQVTREQVEELWRKLLQSYEAKGEAPLADNLRSKVMSQMKKQLLGESNRIHRNKTTFHKEHVMSKAADLLRKLQEASYIHPLIKQLEAFFGITIADKRVNYVITGNIPSGKAFETKLLAFMKKNNYKKQDPDWFPAPVGTFDDIEDTGTEYYIMGEADEEPFEATIDPVTKIINIV